MLRAVAAMRKFLGITVCLYTSKVSCRVLNDEIGQERERTRSTFARQARPSRQYPPT